MYLEYLGEVYQKKKQLECNLNAREIWHTVFKFFYRTKFLIYSKNTSI